MSDFELTDTMRAILQIMQEWSYGSQFDTVWMSYDELIEDLKGADIHITREEAREIMKTLKKERFVFYGARVDCDYRPHGSGYFLTSKGMQIISDENSKTFHINGIE